MLVLSSAATSAQYGRPTGERAILARQTAISLGDGPGFTPGRGGSSSSRSRVAKGHLSGSMLGLVCACFNACEFAWLSAQCARISGCLESCRAPPCPPVSCACDSTMQCPVGPPESRTPVRVWCFRVLAGACAARHISGAYRVQLPCIGRAACHSCSGLLV